MGLSQADREKLLVEIRYWLTSTKLFCRAFEVQRHFATQWSVIHTLAPRRAGSAIALRELLKAVPPSAQKRSSKHHDVSACIEDLRRRGFVRVQSDGADTALGSEGSFLVDVTVLPQSKLREAAQQYTRSLLRELFGWDFYSTYVREWSVVRATVFYFSMYSFSKVWTQMVLDMMRFSFTDEEKLQTFVNQIAGSTEYFMMLMSLWEANLIEDDAGGYSKTILRWFPRFVPSVTDKDARQFVDRLIKTSILVPVGDTQTSSVGGEERDDHLRYRLGQTQTDCLARHAEEFIALRQTLRKQIEDDVMQDRQKRALS